MTVFDLLNRMLRSAKTAVGFGLAMALTIACAQTNPNSPSKDRLILGALDIPVVDGSEVPENCKLETIFRTGSNIPSHTCAIFPVDPPKGSSDIQQDYSAELQKVGWLSAGGEANVIRFEKPFSESCSFSLGLLGWPYGSQTASDSYMRTGSVEGLSHFVLIFLMADEPVCGNSREAITQ